MRGATAADYERVLDAAVEAARQWRRVPAPQARRGDPRCSRRSCAPHKDALGSLVSLENGKIKAEGDGEVQEMIDIADFAVGQSRMLYGVTMHSERAQHRMYEQWHPLGVVGVISAFNFPVAVWSWNAFLACHLRQRHGVEALAEDRTVRARRPAAVQPRARAASRCPRSFRSSSTPARSSRSDSSTIARVALRVVHRLDTRRPPGRRARGRAARQESARARRQQRHHRG